MQLALSSSALLHPFYAAHWRDEGLLGRLLSLFSNPTFMTPLPACLPAQDLRAAGRGRTATRLVALDLMAMLDLEE